MKANMTTLSIYELRKTIGLWKSRKITDSTISKLLDLYLGVTAYMNDEAVYPVENFYDLGLSLKFKNARCLVEAVRQSRSFGIVPDGNVYGMKSFYSYLWKAKDAAESLPETLPEHSGKPGSPQPGNRADRSAGNDGKLKIQTIIFSKRLATLQNSIYINRMIELF